MILVCTRTLEAMSSARSMETKPQAPRAQKRKAKGDAPSPPWGPDTPAEQHGAERASSAFSLEETVSEYRALRAIVLRLWIAAGDVEADPATLRDIIRFDDAAGILEAIALDLQPRRMGPSAPPLRSLCGRRFPSTASYAPVSSGSGGDDWSPDGRGRGPGRRQVPRGDRSSAGQIDRPLSLRAREAA
jgi:hypothetical protein